MKRMFFILLLLLATGSHAQSPNMLGFRLGTLTDMEDPYIGVEFLTGLDRHIDFNPNFEYVLTDLGTYYSVNADIHYDLYTVHRGPFVFLGAGLAFTRFKPEKATEGESDLGANLFFGTGLDRPGYVPYIQIKFITGDYADTALNVGVRFRL